MKAACAFDRWLGDWNGWEHFTAAHARGKGVLLVTPHLGNWEFGGAFLVEHGYKLLVLTQPEPDQRLTELRQASPTRCGASKPWWSAKTPLPSSKSSSACRPAPRWRCWWTVRPRRRR